MFGEISPRKKARAPFISIEEALEETRRGHMIILMDDEQRENEGDLCMAAEKATPEAINFMAKFGRGLICLPMSAERIDRLGLSMMVGDNQAPLGTAFTTAITARRASGSGISAQDRCDHDSAGGARRRERRRVHHARLRLSAARARRRRAGAHRPDRGRGRPRAAGGTQAGRRHLRDSERRRHDGAARRPGRVRQACTGSRS